MTGSNAIFAIQRLFEKSLRESCGREARGGVVMTPAPPPGKGQSHLIALSISSYLFRIVTLFDIACDRTTAAHLAKITLGGRHDAGRMVLRDTYAEFVNIVCGTAKRGLHAFFPHIGMSTPFFLESGCASHIDTLKPTHCRSLEAVVNDALRFRLTLCLFASPGSALDFHLDFHEEEDAPSGELEFF